LIGSVILAVRRLRAKNQIGQRSRVYGLDLLDCPVVTKLAERIDVRQGRLCLFQDLILSPKQAEGYGIQMEIRLPRALGVVYPQD
jgi:hypothetical protein